MVAPSEEFQTLLEAVDDINMAILDVVGIPDSESLCPQLFVTTDCSTVIVEYLGAVIWNSENDDIRDEATNELIDFREHFKAAINTLSARAGMVKL